MLDRHVGLTCPHPEGAADTPSAREIGVQCQCLINERYHGADVFAEIGQCEGSIREDGGVVAGHFQGTACEIDALQPVEIRIFTAPVNHQHSTTDCGPSECGTVPGIALDRLLDEMERLGGLLFDGVTNAYARR